MKFNLIRTVVRNNVFETASSAVHSLAISRDSNEKSVLEISSDGYIHVALDEYYGKEERTYFSQVDKMRYIMTCIYHRISWYNPDNDNLDYWFYDDYMFKDIERVTLEHINKDMPDNKKCLGIKIKPELEYYFDHQIDDYCVVNLYDPDAVVNFIFNPNVGLLTDCD